MQSKASKIIDGKSATCYGIVGCAISICESILKNTSQIRSVSRYLPSSGVCLSLLCILGSKGLQQSLPPSLDEDEMERLNSSTASKKQIINKYETLSKEWYMYYPVFGQWRKSLIETVGEDFLVILDNDGHLDWEGIGMR